MKLPSIDANRLRTTLPSILERTRRGEEFTVVYRSRPMLHVTAAQDAAPAGGVAADPLFNAPELGRSADGVRAAQHDAALYGGPRAATAAKRGGRSRGRRE